jgi:hypothetical protein
MWFFWLVIVAAALAVGGIVAGGVAGLIFIPIAVIVFAAGAGSFIFSGKRANATADDVQDVKLRQRGRTDLSPGELTRLRTKEQ